MVITESNVKRAVELLKVLINTPSLSREEGDATDRLQMFIERGALDQADKLFSLDRKVLVVTDSGVPAEYAARVAEQCREAHVVTVPEGEGSKSVATLEVLLDVMLKNNFARTDCVVAVGGGIVGDLAGFAAASYMRGIDFYNIPTTVLSMVDSSVGGKTAVNFGGIKNTIGAANENIIKSNINQNKQFTQ